jgi:hypothetical protein
MHVHNVNQPPTEGHAMKRPLMDDDDVLAVVGRVQDAGRPVDAFRVADELGEREATMVNETLQRLADEGRLVTRTGVRRVPERAGEPRSG